MSAIFAKWSNGSIELNGNVYVFSVDIKITCKYVLSYRLSLGYFIDRFHVNKVRLWSAANLLMGLTGIAVAHSNQILALILLGGLLGKSM